MNSKNIEKSILIICIAIIAVLAIGTAVIPAVIATKHGWGWLMLYPFSLILIRFWAKNKK